MAGAAFVTAVMADYAWCFSREEIMAIDSVRARHVDSDRRWILSNATTDPRIDAVVIHTGNKSICLSKRISKDTNSVVYDIAAVGEAVRTVSVFPAVKAALQRYLQVSRRLDDVWGTISLEIQQEKPAPG